MSSIYSIPNRTVLFSIFACFTLVGFACFSGIAFGYDTVPGGNQPSLVPGSSVPGDYVTREELAYILSNQQQVFGKSEPKKRFTFTPYGYINVSTSYESERTVNGDYALYSRSPDLDGGGHSGFHVDPKSSRLGLKIAGPDFAWNGRCFKTNALFEFDFQGNLNSTRNRPGFLFRRGYVDFTDKDTRFLIGQEWEVISPLVPQSLNYVPGSCAGNLGYRRAQIRLEKTRNWSCDFNTIWQLAVCDNIPDSLESAGVNTANGGWPMIQARFGASLKTFGAHAPPLSVGISGHIGELRYDYPASGIYRERHESWSANLDIQVPIMENLHVSGEIYTGTNLSSVLGGIMQGVNFYSPGSTVFNPRSAKASGGWINIHYELTKKLHFNLGYSIEDMPDVYASAPIGENRYSGRSRNQVLFLNGIYNWTDYFMTGLEVSQWKTDWREFDANTGTAKSLEPGETTRVEFLVRYSF